MMVCRFQHLLAVLVVSIHPTSPGSFREESLPSTNIVTCIIDILNSYFTTCRTLIVFNTMQLDNFESVIGRNYTVPIIRIQPLTINLYYLNRLGYQMRFKKTALDYIFILKETSNFLEIIHRIYMFWYSNPPVRCMVVLCTNNHTIRDIRYIFEILVQLHIVDVIVVTPYQKTEISTSLVQHGAQWSDTVVVYTYFPFSQFHCRLVKEITMLDIWIQSRFLVGHDLFPNKVNNLYRCPIQLTSSFHFPTMLFTLTDAVGGFDCVGIYGELIRSLQAKMNFTFPLHLLFGSVFHIGHVYPNNTLSGDFKDISNGKFDGSLKITYPHPQIEKHFDLLLSRHYFDFVWISPLPQEYPRWMNLFFPFQLHLWILVAIAFIVIVLSLKGIAILGADRNSSLIQHAVLQSLSVLLDISVPHDPSKVTIRLIFISWVLVSIILSTSYQASFFGFLTKPKTYGYVSNSGDVVNSGLAFGGDASARNLFHEYGDKYVGDKHIARTIFNNWVTENNGMRLIERLVEKGDFVFVKDRSSADVYRYTYTDVFGRRLFHLGDEILYFGAFAFYMKRGSMFSRPFQRIIDLCFDAGLYLKWKENSYYYYRQLLKKGEAVTFIEKEKHQAISLVNLMGAFIILGVGLLCGLVVLLFEVTNLTSLKKRVRRLGVRRKIKCRGK